MNIKEDHKTKGKIKIEVDEFKSNKANIEIVGDEMSLMYLLAMLLRQLQDMGISKELLQGAINVGIEKEKIQVREIRLNKEQEEKLKEILKHMGVNINGSKK